MHISDGVLSAPVLAAGWIITAVFIALAIRWSKKKGIEVEVIPKLSVMTAVFFVVCLVHIPIGPFLLGLSSKLFFFSLEG